MASVPTFDRGGTIGVEYLGVVFSSILYGVTCIQSFQYFRSVKAGSDAWWIRSMVLALLTLDTIHQAFLIHVPYYYLIAHYGDPEALLKDLWSIPSAVALTTIIAFISNSFFVYRIWKLSSNAPVSLFCFVCAIAESAAVLTYCVKFYFKKSLLDAELSLKTTGLAAIAIAAVANVFISAIMTFYLNASRTGLRRSDSVITKLIVLVVSTGTSTTVALVADLISYTIAPDLLYVLMFEFMVAKLFVNSTLTCLNLRDHINSVLSDKSANSIHLSRIGNETSVPTSQRAQIANLSPSVNTDPIESRDKYPISYSFDGSEV
ncbi:hypothetical protein FA95DRAFT_1609816 [Auriscalpium vulgare]|uniref:Uncharacterized protein n=1 Tax=Auriscalpium vulgare TaxID=40419 RepID=A0ACB8RG70_9AGAM|nr:hypothetical protein FA95DRAFT_1609816 [Auriscalpium vulgare]